MRPACSASPDVDVLAGRKEGGARWPLDVRLDELEADLVAPGSVGLPSPVATDDEAVGVVTAGLVRFNIALCKSPEVDELHGGPASRSASLFVRPRLTRSHFRQRRHLHQVPGGREEEDAGSLSGCEVLLVDLLPNCEVGCGDGYGE